jgi:hypothetical protein
MRILHNIMLLGFNGTTTNVWTTTTIPSCTNNTSNQLFCLMQDAHTLYMDLSNLVSIQIKFKPFTIRFFTYIHSQCQWAISMEAKLIYKNVAWKIHGCHAHGTKCVLVQKWNVKLVVLTITLTKTFINRFQ